LGESGVSMGTSKKLVHPLTKASNVRLTIVATFRAVIDFFEQIVVLADEDVLRIERDRLFVCLSRVLESSFVLVRDTEIVPRGGIGGIEFYGFLPPIRRFLPQAVLRDLDPEVDLRLRV
jgi:hypothetical protein